MTRITPAISSPELKRLLEGGVPVKVFDVRLRKDCTPVDHPIPGTVWRDPEAVDEWREEIVPGDTAVVYCVHGRRVSQGVCAALRSHGLSVSYLQGGIEGWASSIVPPATIGGD